MKHTDKRRCIWQAKLDTNVKFFFKFITPSTILLLYNLCSLIILLLNTYLSENRFSYFYTEIVFMHVNHIQLKYKPHFLYV